MDATHPRSMDRSTCSRIGDVEGRSSRARHELHIVGSTRMGELEILLVAVGGLMLYVAWAFVFGLSRSDHHR